MVGMKSTNRFGTNKLRLTNGIYKKKDSIRLLFLLIGYAESFLFKGKFKFDLTAIQYYCRREKTNRGPKRKILINRE